MRSWSGVTLAAVLAACGSHPQADEPAVEAWEVAGGGEPDHVMIGPGAVIHASEDFAEVARLPPDAGMLGLRVLELGYWLIVTPSTKSCATPSSPFREVELQFAVDIESLTPVAKSAFSTHFPDGTSVLVARGAPMRRLDELRFELVAGGVVVPLRFELDPTTYFHATDSVYFVRKPHDGYRWDWSGPLVLEVGPTELRGRGWPSRPFFELMDRGERRVELNHDCARISAKIGGDAPLPPTQGAVFSSPREFRLEPGTRLIWPTGQFAGRVIGSVDVRRVEVESGLRCFDFEPFVLCEG